MDVTMLDRFRELDAKELLDDIEFDIEKNAVARRCFEKLVQYLELRQFTNIAGAIGDDTTFSAASAVDAELEEISSKIKRMLD